MLNVGLLDGLLGVAGMKKNIVDLWIPENSLRLARTSKKMWNPKMLIHYSEISFLGGSYSGNSYNVNPGSINRG